MLHMTVQENHDRSVVRLSGRLEGESVAEARKVCFSVTPPLLVDATELQDATAEGLSLLIELMAEGAQVEGLSGYLTTRIRTLRERGDTPQAR